MDPNDCPIERLELLKKAVEYLNAKKEAKDAAPTVQGKRPDNKLDQITQTAACTLCSFDE